MSHFPQRFSLLLSGKLDLLPRLYLPLLLILCAAYAWHPLSGGDDVWAHAAVGRWSWHHFSVPHQTLFLWGTDPVPWVAHSWLSQLVFYGLMAAGGERYGPYVVVVFTMLMVMLVFALLWRLWTRHAPVTVFTPLLFALAILSSALRFRPRPELFTALFLTMLLTFLMSWSGERDEQRQPSSRSTAILQPRVFIPALMLLFVLWANFHGAVTIGLAILTLTVICDLLQDRGNGRARVLALTALLCIAVTFINPFGVEYWREVVRSVRSETFTYIDEWKPFWKHPPLPWRFALGEAVLVFVAGLAWACNPRRRWAHLAWLLLMSAAFLSSRRHLWLLPIVTLAVMAVNAQSFDTRRLWKSWRQGTRQEDTSDIPSGIRLVAQGGVILCLIAWIITAPSGLISRRAVSSQVPEGAAQYVLRYNPPGRMFNDYEYSSYLQWRSNGQVPSTGQVSDKGRYPLFIDLLNAYPDQVMVDYFDILKATPRGRKLLETFKIRYALLGPHRRDSGLAKYLDGNTKWKRTYHGKDATIWMRRDA